MECKFWFLPKNEGVTNLRNSLVFSLSGQKDSNLRPPAPKAGALAGLRHTPKKKTMQHRLLSFAEKGGFEPPVPFAGYDSLANCWFQPLTHLSRCELRCKSRHFPVTCKLFSTLFFNYSSYHLNFRQIFIWVLGLTMTSHDGFFYVEKCIFYGKNDLVYK